MMVIHCPCGAVRIDLSRAPAFLVDCDCSLCSASHAYWGYFNPAEVRVEGETVGCTRDDKEQPSAEVHRCVKCDATTHFRLTPHAQAKFGNTMMGVNLKLTEPASLAGVELRFPDGKNWSGEGDFSYRQAPVTL